MIGAIIFLVFALFAVGARADETWTTAVLATPSLTSPSGGDTFAIIHSGATNQTTYAQLMNSVAITGGSAIGLSLLGVTNSGVFTNTQMNEYATSLLNSISPSTEFSGLQGGNFATDALTGGVAVPGTSTVYQSNAVAAYATNASTTTNVVALYSQIAAKAASTKNWAANVVCADKGFAVTQCSGLEIDINISSASSAGANGLSILGASTATPTSGAGVVVGPLGTGIKWPGGAFSVVNGSSNTAFTTGLTATSGNNVTSQAINMTYTNGSGTSNNYKLQVDASQVLELTTSAGSGSASLFVDGTVLINAPNGSRATLDFTDAGTTKYQFFREATNDNFFLFDNGVNTTALQIASGNITLGETSKAVVINGTTFQWAAPTGTPAASLCLDASNNIIKKTTSGACI